MQIPLELSIMNMSRLNLSLIAKRMFKLLIKLKNYTDDNTVALSSKISGHKVIVCIPIKLTHNYSAMNTNSGYKCVMLVHAHQRLGLK